MPVTAWHAQAIRRLFSGTLPGDWGDDGDPDTGVAVLRSTNFRDDGSIDYGNLAFRSIAPARLEKRRVCRGTILIEKAGGSSTRPAGRVVYCDRDFDGTASNFVEIVRVAHHYVPLFVFYLLHWNYHKGRVHKYQQQTTGIINFKLREYSDEEVLVPDNTAEQSKIAEVLSTVDRAIEQTEALIAKQQRIKTGLMQDLLTRGIDEHGNLRSEQTHKFKDSPLRRIPVEWNAEPIEVMLERIIDYRGRTPTKVEAGIPLLTAKNVRDGYLDEEPPEFIADEDFEKWMTRGIPVVGDVLFTTEAPMGNVARVPIYRIALAQRILTLCPKPKYLTQDFLFWLLHWHRTTERLELFTSGSTVTGVKQSVFRKVVFAFPKEDEQERISEVLDSHANSSANQKKNLEKLHSLKRGLMHDLLTGKRRVTALLEQDEGATA